MRDYLDRARSGPRRPRSPSSTRELRELLVPRDPDDGKNVIVEIRGGEGGEEGNLWAADLFHMYERYADQHRWKVEVLSSQPSDMGGFRDITFVVKGDDAWSRLKHEAGPHRVQRVPATESQGRVHTSAATVAVLPEAEEIDVAIDPNDLEIDVYRSSGPGGQSVNTTDSAVRITHKPSGLVVTCQDEKSQLQNKEKAMRILRSRLLEIERERQEQELSSARRSQVKSGGRSDKIRTYNYKENRVTDHRIGLTLHSLDQVLAGQLDDRSPTRWLADERAEQLADGAAADLRLTCHLGRPARATRRRVCATAPVAAPDTEARWMVERVSGYDGAELVMGEHEPATAPAAAHLDDMLDRRVGRASRCSTCSGAWHFLGLDLLVDRRVLVPRPETEVVAQVAIDEAARLGQPARAAATRGRAPRPNDVVADLGTGSGALALALASELPDAEVWAADVSDDALAVARANVAGIGSAAATRVRVARGSWFDALPTELRGRVRIVVANPPYVAEHEVAELPPTSPTGSRTTRW